MSATAFGQNFTFKGKVSSKKNGEPLIGATIIVKGTTTGTITNIDGEYTLNTNLKAGTYELLFRSIGYQTATKLISLNAKTSISLDIALEEDAFGLDEVVVTGSTLTSSRRQLGNAITSIKADQLQNTGSSNLSSALQGKIPGAQITQNSGDPSGGISIRLRGVKSLQGSSDPLYVIDGVVISNASTNVSQLASANQAGNDAVQGTNRLADINPQDIETLNVLNGSAAAAIYGSRASNGVVVITTKRGKSGTPKVTFSTSVNVNELRKKVYISTYGKQFGSAALRLHTIGAAPAGVESVGIVRDGVTTKLATNLVDVTRYDYQDNIFQTGYGNDNYLSINGGTDKTQYFASISYMKNQGIIKNTDFQRYGLRLRIEQRLADWAKVSAGLTYTNSFSNEKPNGNVFYSPINSVNITNNIYDITQKDPLTGGLKAVEPSRVNPLSPIEDFDFNQSVSRTINDLQFNLTPLKGLSIDYILGVDYFSQLGKNYIPPYPYQAEAGLPAERYPNGFAGIANGNSTQINTDLNVSYEKDLTSSLKLNAVAGFNYQFTRRDYSKTTGENLTSFIQTVSGAASNTVLASYGLDRYSVSGQFAQTTFGYKNQVFLTGAIRRDGSTLFSSSETNQFYPKVSGSWVISDADFWKNGSLSNTVNGLKFRASFGDAGGLSAIGTYDRFWQFLPTAYQGFNTFVPSSKLANSRVRPERMRELEFGLDVSLLKDRVSLGVTNYSQNISELVVNRTLASSTGGLSFINNVGEMENKGWEAILSVTPIKKKDLTWDLTMVYSRNRNKVISAGSPSVAINTVSGAPSYLIEGQPASVFYAFYYARNPDGSLLLTPQGFPQRERGTIEGLYGTPKRDANGQPTGDYLKKIIGNPNPDYTASLTSSLTYKRFNFRFLLDAVQGLQVFNADKRTRQGVGIGDYAEKELKGELPRGYIFSIYTIEEWRIDDGSYVKLREVSLGYSFKNPIKGMSNLNLSLIGRNLYSWDKYNGYDPETNAGGNSDILRGVDFGNVPIPRSYQLTLTANF